MKHRLRDGRWVRTGRRAARRRGNKQGKAARGRQKVLWVLTYDTGFVHSFHMLYAASRQEAECKKQAWIEQQGLRVARCISFLPTPEGFALGIREWPGIIDT